MFKNEHYKSDFEYDMKLNRTLLKIIGVWPNDPDENRWEKIVRRLARVTSMFLLVFLFVPHGCHIFLVEKNFSSRIKMVGAWSFCAMAILKYVIVLARIDGLRFCIERITFDWQNVDGHLNRKIMLENAKACRSFTKLCALFMYSGSIFWSTILPLLTMAKNYENFDTTRNKSIIDTTADKRSLPYPSQFFIFDSRMSPMYEIVFVGHTISVTILCTVASGVCTLAVKFVMHACSQYQIVISLLECFEIRKDSKSNDARKKLADIVKRHLDVLTFVPSIESIMNEVCLVEMVGSTLNICFIGNYLITEWEECEALRILTYIVLLMSFVSNIFIFCYIGEILAEQSKKVGFTAYTIDWWCLPRSQARAVIMLIAASNFPVKFTAGKMTKLSLQTFFSVIKAAVTYMNVLRNAIS